MGKIGGYVGTYNGNLLKSSYEYIYAKILENDNVSYKVEHETYLLDEGKTYYTPDFFLFQDLDLYEIVEIRGHRFNLEERVESLAKLREILSKDIKLTLLTELDLREMCSDRGMSYNSLKTEWRENPNNIKGSNQGRANSMYGKTHKEETKKLLSEIRQQAIAEDPQKYKEIGERLAEWSRQNDWAHSKGKRVWGRVYRNSRRD